LFFDASLEHGFGFNHFGVQGGKQILRAFEDVPVYLRNIAAWHALVPDINNDEDVLDAHFLEQAKELLTTSFFV
jgi:hypothetical protein